MNTLRKLQDSCELVYHYTTYKNHKHSSKHEIIASKMYFRIINHAKSATGCGVE